MRLLLSILLLGTSFNGVAQDPDLFRTWHLYELQATDLAPVYYIWQIDPPIRPYIEILPNLEFSGEGACNTFSGTYTFQSSELTSMDLTHTTDDCGVPVHNAFEDAYFWFMEYFWFEINNDGTGLVLELGHPLLGYAIFKDYELSVEDNSLSSRIKLFPNPTSDRLSISSEGIFIESIQVFNINGKLLLTETSNWQDVNVSGLTTGIYLLRIEFESGTTVKKFVKK